jgi:hypothetical protein
MNVGAEETDRKTMHGGGRRPPVLARQEPEAQCHDCRTECVDLDGYASPGPQPLQAGGGGASVLTAAGP